MRASYSEAAGGAISDAEFERALNKVMFKEVGDIGFVGYLKIVAQEGFTLSRTDSTDEYPIEVSGDWAYVYWIVEIVLAGLTAGWLAAREARQPFDEEANAWYGKRTLFAVSPTKARKELVNALKDGDFLQAGSLITTDPLKYGRNEIWIRRSPVASSLPQDVYVILMYAQRVNRRSPFKTGVVSPSELDLIQRGMQQAARQNAQVASSTSR